MDGFGPDQSPQTMAELADAMRRQRQMGLLAQLSGDRVLAPIGKSLSDANDEESTTKALAGAMAIRQKQAEEDAWKHPASNALLRGAIGQFMPGTQVPQDTPTQVLRNFVPTAEKYGASLQAATIKAGTPHGRQWAEVNWTNPVTGAQDRHLLNMLDGSRWSLDGVTQLSPSIKGWHAPAGAGQQEHGAPMPPAAPAPAPAAPPVAPAALGTPAPAPTDAAPPAPPKRLVAPGSAAPSQPRFSRTPAGEAAKAIYEGRQPPDLKNQRYAAGVKQELERNGFNLSDAQLQWGAAQKNLASLNSPQQTRLRQAIGAAPHMLDNIEGLYNEWEKLGGATQYKVINRASLAAAKNVGGRMGEVAQALEANIADLVSDLGTIYQGGNTPTEHAMHLALQNLDANWNPGQFRELLKQARKNIGYRSSAMNAAGPVGTGGENRYAPRQGGEAPSAKPNDPLGIL
jgi:hypothetical protein